MKTVLIFPPCWIPTAFYLAVPLLAGQLQAEGYDAVGLDINNDILNYFLTKEKIVKTIEEINSFISSYELNPNEQNKRKYESIKSYMAKNKLFFERLPDEIDSALEVIRSKKDFYDKDKFLRSRVLVTRALEIISLNSYPSAYSLWGHKNPGYKFNMKDFKKFTEEKEKSIFYEYFQKVIKEKLSGKEINCFGISITAANQVFPALLLANMLKEQTNAKVIIGGNYFSKILKQVKKHPEFFDLFCDFLLFGEGENSLVETVKFINNEISIYEVSGILYKNSQGEVVENDYKVPKEIETAANVSLEGYDLTKRFLPETVFPLQTSKGCYWNKCSFCTSTFKRAYCVKSIDKIIQEIKNLNNNYGISFFDFVDECISPSYLEALSGRIIEEKLNIHYYIYARHEKGFTKKIFKKAKKSGLRMILWGYESGSERVMKLINKGVDYNNRMKIMKDAANVGIWNHAFAIFGFPTETEDEARKTQNELNNNPNIIHSSCFAKFSLESENIYKDPSKYGLSNVFKDDEDEFALFWKYDTNAMSRKQISEFYLSQHKFENKFNLFVHKHFFRQELFLYLVKYDIKKVRKMKIKSWKDLL